MKKVLFVGEHPMGYSGNSHMMRAILSQINDEKYSVACFCKDFDYFYDKDIFTPIPFNMISATEGRDPWGPKKLISVIANANMDVIVFTGIDIWRYCQQLPQIAKLRDEKGFKWLAIFPYDLQTVRPDWVRWINMVDYPCVYSEYGKNLLEDHVSNIRYYRPPLDNHEIFVSYDDEERAKRRKLYFSIEDDRVIFGFIGNNQLRKDPLKIIKAFEIVKKKCPEAVLYLHTDVGGDKGVYNIVQSLKDTGLQTGDILTKQEGIFYSPKSMVDLFNAIDVLVNCSYQEGLSWTLVEAMLCGTPIVATDTTSQIELIKDVGSLVPCEDQALLPLICESGQSWIEAKQCKAEDLADAMIEMAENRDFRKQCKERGLQKGREWIEGVSDINSLLDEATETPTIEKKKVEAVLFAQHSAAGDVFMTTRCLKGIKERHGSLPIVYMTSPQYVDIVDGNPYIDSIIPWDNANLRRFKFVYNPHGEKIAPGHWGRNCNSILSDFYWKILGVEPDDFYIEKRRPKQDFRLPDRPVCIVHTTGGDPHFRTYKYMDDVVAKMGERYFTVQVGGGKDYPAKSDLDLRGKLTFRETAWVMDKASLAVTVDSFISHLAGALGISQVCLFGSGNAIVTRPSQVKGQLICLSPDYVRDCPGLGPCSAAIRECPAPCTGRHTPQSILEAIREIESNNMVRRNTEHETSLCVFKHAE